MYNCIACLVLFDARGDLLSFETLAGVAVALKLFLLCVSYLPMVLYRPRLVDDLCVDVIAFATQAAGIVMLVSDPRLLYACALHAMCFHVQQHSRRKAQHPVLVDTALALLLLAAYAYGPRITDIRQFVISAVAPIALDMCSTVLVQVHGLVVSRLVVEV